MEAFRSFRRDDDGLDWLGWKAGANWENWERAGTRHSEELEANGETGLGKGQQKDAKFSLRRSYGQIIYIHSGISSI